MEFQKFGALSYPIDLAIDQDTSYFRIDVVKKIPRPFPTTSQGFLQEAESRSSEGGDIFGGNIQSTRGIITLPMPLGVSNQNSVNWQNGQLNFLESLGSEAITNALNGIAGSPSFQQGLSSLTGPAKELIEALTRGISDPSINAAARQGIAAQILKVWGSNVSGNQLISRSTGQVLNPNLELLFDGVNLRDFDFDFIMTPRSKEESDNIKQIIRQLQKAKAASYGSNGAFIKQPLVFRLGFYQGTDPHPFLFNMKTCAMTSMSVNYSASSQQNFSSYSDGTPTSLQMNLSFTELSPIYQEDYETGKGLNGVGY